MRDENLQTEYDDLFIFDFSDVAQRHLINEKKFYDATAEAKSSTIPFPTFVFGIGCPGYRNTIDFESNIYFPVCNAAVGKPIKPQMRDRISFLVEPQLEWDPAGMSGGAAFGINNCGPHWELFACGLITNASKSVFNVIPFPTIVKLIEMARWKVFKKVTEEQIQRELGL
ncbi:MAG: hypothetical protein WBA67_06105 [Jannaschia sp.]